MNECLLTDVANINVDSAKKVQKLLKLSLVSTTFSLVQKEPVFQDPPRGGTLILKCGLFKGPSCL